MSKVIPLATWLPIPLDELTLGRPVAMSIDDDAVSEKGIINGRSAFGVILLDDNGDEWDIPEQDIEDGTIKLYQCGDL